jgi:hypothetical protein
MVAHLKLPSFWKAHAMKKLSDFHTVHAEHVILSHKKISGLQISFEVEQSYEVMQYALGAWTTVAFPKEDILQYWIWGMKLLALVCNVCQLCKM